MAIGGNGGAGGSGGTATFSLSNGGTITTLGNGAVGALVQSIGGGGGDGGDSSAMSAVLAFPSGDSAGVELTATVGGNGGKAGNGGNVGVVEGGTISADGSTPTCDCNGTATLIQTTGDFAPGIMAQSIGGGGGNAGQGSSSTQDFGTSYTTSLSIGLGSHGSPGGTGGNVNVWVLPGTGIQTWGSAAAGIIAQSIGGGGGTSQGGSFGIAQSFKDDNDNSEKPGMNVNLGNQTSAPGSNGGSVSVTVQAPIRTHGNDATGVLAQSIGGGGLGGSSGSDGSADNPVLLALEGREEQSNVINGIKDGSLPQSDTTMNLSMGGTGGNGGPGGSVTVSLASIIATLGNPVVPGGNQMASTGDWAHGIVAQSIGGGGGKGGTGMASGSGSDPAEHNVNLDYAVGGSGGTGGDGGSVNVNFQTGAGISTVGYGATGVLAQSVGGGGGFGADGSDAAGGNLSVGGASGGSGGGGGNGGTVDFENSAINGGPISTAGTFADGINLQSIGGGGGTAGAGSSAWINFGLPHVSASMTLSAGGGSAAGGTGGDVYVNQNYANNLPLNINVSGYGAYGIVAQSIGGGGGNVIANQAGTGTPSITLGGRNGSSAASGGSVVVKLTTPSTINASGIAGIGVLAQSVGDGGGIIRLYDGANTTPSLITGPNSTYANPNQSSSAQGNGGSVTVKSYATIQANGPGGIGIFAQSVGGGGGLVLNGGTLYAGVPVQHCTSDCPSSSQYGVTVDVAGGSVSATGVNGIGIFAQADGYGGPPGSTPDVIVGNNLTTVTVTGGYDPNSTGAVGGTAGVQAAAASKAAAIWIDRPTEGTTSGPNQDNYGSVTVNSGGVVTTAAGSSGTAIKVTGGGIGLVTNYGSITGNLDLNDSQAVDNWDPGPWTPGPLTLRGGISGARGSLNNFGTWVPGPLALADILNQGTVAYDNPQMTTQVFGRFNQTASGRYSPLIDSLNKTVSFMNIAGNASIDGTIAPNAVSLLPGTVDVLTAGSLATTAQARDSLLFDWDAKTHGNTISITPNATFTPAGASLNDSQKSLAQYNARAWNNSDPLFARMFAGLSRINDAATYRSTLNALSAKATQAQSIALANQSGVMLGSSMSCPIFIDNTVKLSEDSCVWGQISGRWTDQSTTGDTLGYHVSGTTYRIGGQREIAPGWFLGASAAAGQTWARMTGGSSGDGDTYDGSLTLKRVNGPWYFAGSVAAATGSFHNNRNIDIDGVNGTMTSSPNMFMIGTRFRAGYEFTYDTWYMKPYNDVDLVYTHMPGFSESGNAPGALKVRGSDKTNVVLTPMLEFGTRSDIDSKTSLRAYAAFGISWRPDSSRSIHSSFIGASAADGTFTDYVKSPEVLGKIDLGVQLFKKDGFEVKASYTADLGGSFSSQTASARFAYHF